MKVNPGGAYAKTKPIAGRWPEIRSVPEAIPKRCLRLPPNRMNPDFLASYGDCLKSPHRLQ